MSNISNGFSNKEWLDTIIEYRLEKWTREQWDNWNMLTEEEKSKDYWATMIFLRTLGKDILEKKIKFD